VGQLPLASGVEPSGHVCSLLLSSSDDVGAVPSLVLSSSDDVEEAKVRLLFDDGIAVSIASIRIPDKAKAKVKSFL
jgi:hypothetical protein